MSKSSPAFVVLTLLLVFEAETTSPSRKGVAMRAAYVSSESGQGLLWSVVARSLVHCHLLCVGNDWCDGFIFAKMSPTTQGRCQGWTRSSWQAVSWGSVISGVNYVIKMREFDLEQATTTLGQELYANETATATQVTDENWLLNNTCEVNDDCMQPGSWRCYEKQCLCRAGYYYCQNRNECIASCSSENLRSDLVTYMGIYLDDSKLDNATLNVEEIKCESYCSETSDCRAFNYDTYSSECQLVGEDVLMQAGGVNFGTDELRKYMQKMCC